MTLNASQSRPVESGEGGVELLSRLLHERYSCRGFTSRPVPRPLIEHALELAQRTASWCNLQPWEVIVTEGAGTDRFRDALYAYVVDQPGTSDSDRPDIAFPATYTGVYNDRRRACGRSYYDAAGIASDDRAASHRLMLENFRLFGAPHTMIITTERALGAYSAVDCGGFIANFIIAAQSLGFSSIPQAAIARYSGFVRRYFGLGEHRQVLCAISFGFADPDNKVNAFRTSRAPLPEVVTFRQD